MYVKSEYNISNLSLKVRCVTSHLCQCFVRLKAVRSCESNVASSFNDFTGGIDGSRGRYNPVASIHRRVGELLTKLILQNWDQEGRCETAFVSV